MDMWTSRGLQAQIRAEEVRLPPGTGLMIALAISLVFWGAAAALVLILL